MDDPISVTDPDLYTAVPGWSGKNILAANGMLGADNGRFPVSLSYLWTPTMNLSSNNGKYKIHIKARGTAGDYLSIYRIGYMIDSNGDGEPDALNIHKVTAFDENGYTEETWEMEDGAENMQLSIEENKHKKIFHRRNHHHTRKQGRRGYENTSRSGNHFGRFSNFLYFHRSRNEWKLRLRSDRYALQRL